MPTTQSTPPLAPMGATVLGVHPREDRLQLPQQSVGAPFDGAQWMIRRHDGLGGR